MPASKRAVSFALAGCAWAPPAKGAMTPVATRTIARKVLTGAEIMLRIVCVPRRAGPDPAQYLRHCLPTTAPDEPSKSGQVVTPLTRNFKFLQPS